MFRFTRGESRLPAWVLGLVLVAGSFVAPPLDAQVTQVEPAFRVVDIDRIGEMYVYRYELRGPDRTGEIYSTVHLDVTVPLTDDPPEIHGTEGTFLFDAVGEFHDQFLYSHPSLFVGTPERWSGAIGRMGFLSWLADVYGPDRNYGVRQGERLRGFELRSRGVPSLRRARAVPHRPFPEAGGTASAEEAQVDSTWVLSDTYVLGPGWLPEQVTPEFLRLQVSNACDGLLTDLCDRYGTLAALVEERYEEGARDGLRGAIHLFRQEMAEDRVLAEPARRAFSTALEILEANR